MQVPDYWLPSPEMRLDLATTDSFDRLLDQAMADGPEHPIDYRLDAPKWQFLCHAAGRGDIVLHGSLCPEIQRFEPRQPDDTLEFSNRHAVFAATDGIWPIFHATLDREAHPTMRMLASSIRVDDAAHYYFFSISRQEQFPWRPGTVYLLPADTFEDQPPITIDDSSVRITQAASAVPLDPVAKLIVEPADFPFLARVRSHDDALLTARMAADPGGFPWVAPA